MFRELRRRLSYANVTATLALFVALAGTATAAVIISSNSQVGNNVISSRNIQNGQVKSSDLSAALKASLKLHCPPGLHRAADLCFEDALRAPAQWPGALKTCALAQRRLPDAGELALVFDHLGAPQQTQWVANHFFNGSFNYGARLSENASREILIDSTTDHAYTYYPYRCVTGPSN